MPSVNLLMCGALALCLSTEGSSVQLALRDNAVVAAALSDFRAPGIESPLHPTLGPTGPPFPVGLKPQKCAVEASDVLRPLDRKQPFARSAREAADDLATRKASPDARFTFSVPEFELLAQWRSVMDRSVEVCLPGFSKDGQLAIVLMSVPWGIHHVPTWQVLLFRNGSWTVVFRHDGDVDFMSVG